MFNIDRIETIKIKNHIINSVSNAILNKDPYPHLVIDNYLPDDFYNFLMDNYPQKSDMFNPFNAVRTYENIWQIDIQPDPYVSGASKGQWSYLKKEKDSEVFALCELIHKTLFSDDVKKVYNKKFSIDKKLDKQIMVGRVSIDGYDSGLGPHIDREDKIISKVLYMAKGDEPSKLCGTHLLRPKNDKFVNELEGNTNHLTYEKFNITETVEYIPNRMIAWEVVSNSWHAYHQKYDGDRRSIKMFIQEKLDSYAQLRESKIDATMSSQDWKK